ncbi:MAG TPA: hypothetical protein VMS56_01245 [Thermoanaerobaculia bacterium]|nr:hypothetical protein [Thermoanaerobaculia bacterium]
MRREGCDLELDLIRAMKHGDLPDSLRDHARSCADCSEAAKVAVWMNRMASEAPRSPAPVDPSILRLKAELFGSRISDQKVLQPLHLLQRVGFGVIAFCWAALLTWKWDVIANFSLDRAVASAIEGASVSPSLLAAVFTLGCATVLLTVHTALAGE